MNIYKKVSIYFVVLVVAIIISSNVNAESLTSGLISYYPWNNYNDAQGINNLTNNGASIVSSNFCKIGSCLNLSGVSDSVTKSNPNIPTGASSRTFGCWAYIVSHGTNDVNFFGYGSGSTYQYFGTGADSASGDKYKAFGYGYDYTFGSTSYNQWILMTSVFDGTNRFSYINNNLIDTTNRALYNTGNSILEFGSGIWGGSSNDIYLDDCFIYNRTLSSDEVTKINTCYNNNVTLENCDNYTITLNTYLSAYYTFDSTPVVSNISGLNNVTLFGTSSITSGGKINNALNFPNSDANYARIDNSNNAFNFGSGDWCINTWINGSDVTAEHGVIFATSNEDGSIFNPLFIGNGIGGTSGNIDMYASNNGVAFNCVSGVSMGTYVPNIWQMWTITAINGRLNTYLDGILQSNVSWSCNLPNRNYAFLSNDKNRNPINYHLTGKLDELYVRKGMGCNTSDVLFLNSTSLQYPFTNVTPPVENASLTLITSSGIQSENSINVITTSTGLSYTIINLFNSTGYNIANNEQTCFQEQANVSTACGGLDTGSYANVGNFNPGSGDLGYDANYATYALPNFSSGAATIYMNYTVPTGNVTRDSLWQLVTYSNYGPGISINISIPSDCWAPILQLSIEMYSDVGAQYVYPECYNGASWNILSIPQDSNSSGIYEEAMYWKYVNNTSYNFTNLNNGTYYFNATGLITSNNSLIYSETNNVTIITSINPALYNVTFPYPNNYVTTNPLLTFGFNTSDAFYAHTIYNITGLNLVYNDLINTPNTSLTTLLPDGKYYYSLTVFDQAGNSKFYDPNVTIDATPPSISYTTGTEANNSYIPRNNIFVNLSVSDANLNYTEINLYNSTNLVQQVKSGDCYQKSADIVNQNNNDGNCALNYSGGYSVGNPLSWYGDYLTMFDGDWNTGVDAITSPDFNDSLYINFVKPKLLNSAKLILKTGYSITNITLTPACLNTPELSEGGIPRTYVNLRVRSFKTAGNHYTKVYCEQYSDTISYYWNETYTTPGSPTETNAVIYETAMMWNVNITNYNFQGLSKGTYYFNASAYDIVGNSNSTPTYVVNVVPSFDNNSYSIFFPYSNNIVTNNNTFTYGFTTTDQYYDYAIYNITGLNVKPFGPSPCYQESPNVSNQLGTDGNCGLNYSGTIYYTNSSGVSGLGNENDGNFSTAVTNAGGSTIYVNYSLPSVPVSYAILTKRSEGTAIIDQYWNGTTWVFIQFGANGKVNQTFTTAMFTNNKLQVRYQVYFNGGTGDSESFYEDAVTWFVASANQITNTTNTSLTNILPDGKYYYALTIYDKAGNNKLYDPNVTIDTTPPSISYTTGTEANNSYIPRNNIVVNLSVSDANLNYTIINLYNATGDLINYNYNESYNFTGLSTGTYYFNASAYDLAGNTNSTSTYMVQIIPTFNNNSYNVTFPYNNNAYTTNTTLTYGFTTSDPYYAYTVYNITGLNVIYSNIVNTSNTSLTSTLTDGKYYYALTIYDQAGNNKFYDPNVTIDVTPPSISYTANSESNNSNIYSRNNLYVEVNSSDANMNYTKIDLYNSTGDLINYNYSVSYNFTGLLNGIYYFNATAVDLAGNINYTSTYIETIDYFKDNVSFNTYQKVTNATIPYTIRFTSSTNNFQYDINGSKTTTLNNIPWAIYNVTINSTSAYTCTYSNWNATSNYQFPDCAIFDNVITINATDSYLSTPIVGFNITVNSGNYTESLNNQTTAVFNLIQGQTYDLNLVAPGYININSSFTPMNSSESLTMYMDQTQITLLFYRAVNNQLVNDTTISITDLAIPSKTFNTTNGTLYITPNAGIKNYSMTAGGGLITVPINLNLSSKQISTFNITLYQVLNLSIYDEKSSLIIQTYFNFSRPADMRYTLYCYEPSAFTISLNIVNTTPSGAYAVPAPCVFNRIRFDVVYNNIDGSTFSYYRTLTFSKSTNNFNIPIYLPDHTTTDTVSTDLKPYDIFGIYTIDAQTQIQAFEVFPTGTQLVTSDYVDAEGKMSATLMQGGQYILTVLANGVPVRTLGPYYADVAGTKILRLFDVTLTGPADQQNAVIANTQILQNDSTSNDSIIVMHYQDNTAQTSQVFMAMYNGSCDTPGIFNTTPLIQGTYTNNSLIPSNYNVYMSYNILNGNRYMNKSSNQLYCTLYNRTDMNGNSQTSAVNIVYDSFIKIPASFKNPWTFPWIIMLILVIIALGATARTAAPVSLIISLLAMLLYGWNWFATGHIPGIAAHAALGLAVIIAIFFNLKRVF